jgi:bifunctional N-acetylglucosamine-1-phosphate-uridyltransferase/glucosamine-1-phosphate-acetyltransferase GlmU-like protein
MFVLVFLVAGKSSRFGKTIDNKPKSFARVGPHNETLIEIAVQQALSVGKIKHIVFIVNSETSNFFQEIFGNEYKEFQVSYLVQTFDQPRTRPWGTADAISLLSGKFSHRLPFLICNGDDLYGKQNLNKLVCENVQDQCSVLGFDVNSTLTTGKQNRGIINFDSKTRIVSEIKETIGIERNVKNNGLFCSTNTFILSAQCVDLIQINVDKFKQENKHEPEKECYLPTELTRLFRDEKKTIMTITTAEFESFMGITVQEDVEIVFEKLRKEKQE